MRPDLYRGFNPWDRISDPDALCALLTSAGIGDPRAVAEAGSHPLRSPDDWWVAALGSGYRGTIDTLDDADRDRVQRESMDFVRTANIQTVETNVVFAVASQAY